MLGTNGSTRTLALVALVVLAVGLAACGGGSGSSSTATNASAGSTDPTHSGSTGTTSTTPSTTTPATPSTKTPATPSTKSGKGSSPKLHIKPPSKQALKAHLKFKNLHPHLKLGKKKGTSRAPDLANINAATSALRACLKKQGIPLATGSKPPAGVSSSRYKAAVNACLPALKLSTPGSQGSPGSSERSYAKFVQCMRQNGINMPAPNTSGKGPVLSTSGIDTGSPKFNSAYKRCQSHLPGIKEIAIGPLAGTTKTP